MLAAVLRGEGLAPGAAVLDLCTGSGVVAIAAARLGLRATAVDVSRRAVLAARVNARVNGVEIRSVRCSKNEPTSSRRAARSRRASGRRSCS
jgi:release factor glutamine methyltransferase